MRTSRNVFVVAAVIVVLSLIGLGIYQWRTSSESGSPVADGPLETSTEAEPTTPAEPAWCPAVEVVSVPGTWESAADDDPFNPQANPASFMLSITQPLQQMYDINRVRVFTVPYTAQFRNIQTQRGRAEMTYDDSRAEGTAKLAGELRFVAQTCPSTKFVIAGFSQGAVIVGDVASQIGNSAGPIDPERLLGAVMIADGRRENGVGVNPGAEVTGVGAEIAMLPLQRVVNAATPGATMTGPRPGGFGLVEDRAFEICAPDDTVCDAPQGVGNAIERAQALIAANGNHAMYATNPAVIPGTTVPEWTVGWIRNVVDS
ncbi:cutinase family protein [Corynebacterium sp. zg912]|uniref:Cutinase family protein n=1 Tax=Corynebacterium wankanglinii TaxID=2735136 RepID=A0A7V8UUZ0_9CORY|nr:MULTISPECIES: cutinase family protein [Corynebacterium]MBA1837792.1 cutinase family protein [Corynebacterium wankanglinii]MCR5929103.1 cutinase family protein [Corynebacterium sp. zg912]